MLKSNFNELNPHVNVGTSVTSTMQIDFDCCPRSHPGRQRTGYSHSYADIHTGGTVRDENKNRHHRRLSRRVSK